MWRAAMAAMSARRLAAGRPARPRAPAALTYRCGQRTASELVPPHKRPRLLTTCCEVRRDRRERLVRPHSGHFTAPSAGAGLRATSSGRLWVDATFKVE